ncbi:MAG: NADH-quinone oxidoreductase subunit D [Spirochaetales bacterium]|nr:NADH-quinone oxidoreductase subunit D [Spirochaetales bacterium]MCF7939425.1 NADH-quinone oxidoreductase subunit D [Spirochaetales bacterium]
MSEVLERINRSFDEPEDEHDEVREYTLFIGPNHPGIEGNFALKLSLEGDTIVRAKTDGGYLHRGFEKLMEERLFMQNIAIVCRICVPDPDPNEENYARAVEAIAGIEVPERAKWIRVLVLELSRIASHLFTFGGHAGTIGLYTMPNWSIADRDRILDLFEELTGGRVYHIYNMPGGVRRDFPDGFERRVHEVMDYIESRLPDYDDLFFNNAILRKRAEGIGVLTSDQAIRWGATGPNLRAVGIPADLRRDDTYEVYDKLEFDIPTLTGGDALDRLLVRRKEIEESIRIVRQVVDNIPSGKVWNKQPNPLKWRVPAGDAYVRTESSKGEYAYYMVSDGGQRPYRVHVRGASTTHGVHILENLLVGTRIEDASQVMFSLDACPPEVDR